MRKIGSEVAAGVAILTAFIIFVVGFMVIKNIAIKAGTYSLTITFSDITGLERHDPVSVSGLKIGKVKEFRLDGLDVEVTVELERNVVLPEDSQAQIKTVGMVGEKFIDIIPGNSEQALQNGDVINGSTASDITAITGTMEGLMKQTEELIVKVRTTIDNIFTDVAQSDLRNGIHHISQLSATLDENKLHIQKTLTNLDQLSSNMNEMLNKRRETVEKTIDNIYTATNKLETLTTKIDHSLTSVNTLLAKIENEEGVVGKVIARDEIYNEFRHLTAELDALVQDLKKRPQKYLNLGFIKVF